MVVQNIGISKLRYSGPKYKQILIDSILFNEIIHKMPFI